MPRFTIIVLDSLGVGALPDAASFGDENASTLKHIVEGVKNINIHNLINLGLYNIEGLNLGAITNPVACYGRCKEKSKAKDTTSGHFEIAGLVIEKPYKTFGEAFPKRIIDELEKRIGVKTIGNFPASGTEIIKDLGDEHVATGYPIVYLSADSLMQIAMHEDVIDLKRQYEICKIARELLMGDDTVGRVIARPFAGNSGSYYRTENRKDFAIDPPGPTVLSILKNEGKDVIGIGKIEDIFNGVGITEINHTKNNHSGIKAIIEYLEKDFDGLLFANLVDFDMLYGHRNDVFGYASALEYFDSKLPCILEKLKDDDILIITADHGCDPTTEGTDHTREYIPLLVIGPKVAKGIDLGTRDSFADIAATIAECFKIPFNVGNSFLKECMN